VPVELRESARRFFELITAPSGVAAALGDHASTLDEIVRSDEKAGAIERLEIYANMYFYRILDVMRETYPRLCALVGDDAFHNLVTDYLLTHPSRHPNLRNVGAQLPAFLDGWHADLAALEWARFDVVDEADATPLGFEALRALHPDAFAVLRLEPIPASRRIGARFAVDAVWRGDASEPRDAQGVLLVWRPRCDLDVSHRFTDGDEAEALALLPAPFGLVCEKLALRYDESTAAEKAFGLLAQWAADGVLAKTI
jgi:hypothetical protein